jgi:hypothetical protein
MPMFLLAANINLRVSTSVVWFTQNTWALLHWVLTFRTYCSTYQAKVEYSGSNTELSRSKIRGPMYNYIVYLQYSQRENFGEHLKILIDIATIYYITEFEHPEISIISAYARNNLNFRVTVERSTCMLVILLVLAVLCWCSQRHQLWLMDR